MADTDVSTWYKGIPIITKVWFTGALLGTVLANFGVVSFYQLTMEFGPALKQFQFWRFFTCTLILGKLSFNFLMNLYFLYKYSRTLEEEHFKGKKADFAALVGFVWLSLLLIEVYMQMRFIALPAVFALLYVWSQLYADVTVSFFFGIKFKAMYFPWVLVAFSVLTGGFPMNELLGIFVGHAYYFLNHIVPVRFQRQVFFTPSFLRKIFPDEQPFVQGFNGVVRRAQAGVDVVNRAVDGHNWGTGHRLG